MTTAQPRRPGGDVAATPAPFSYAQAAKGLSGNNPSATAPTKQPAGTTTPSKDATTAPATVSATASTASVPSWADDAEAEDSRNENHSGSRDATIHKAAILSKQSNVQNPVTASNISSPELAASAASSTSTIAKDDDAMSLQNAPSESTSAWENKSQASTSVEKPSEATEKPSEMAKDKNVEKVFKPLQEAPVPSVNPWTRRADELKAKAAQKVSVPKQATNAPIPMVVNGASQSHPNKGKVGTDGTDSKEAVSTAEARFRNDDEKSSQARKEFKTEADSDKAKKIRGRIVEKETKTAATALPLPPHRDQESWPTPDSAVDEDKKRANSKGEKADTERKESSSNRPHGKQEWVTVPYTPNVIFNTPLPNTASSRRGGRGGGRGGSQGGGRAAGFGANGVVNPEKDAPSMPAVLDSDVARRGRLEAAPARDASSQEKRAGSIGSTTANDVKSLAQAGEKVYKVTAGAETEGQNNGFPRQYAQNRSNKVRRGDFAPQGMRRKDFEGVSPTKDALQSHDRRTSTATQTDTPDEGERRTAPLQDGQNGHARPGSNERRFNSFSGRDRGRGGRGARGGYQNGPHQFSNGHTPNLQSASSFPLRSPTTFHPEQNTFFPSAAPHSRPYRNGHRSQSVTTDSVYVRGPGYTGGSQQPPPIQTFMPGMYDYPMVHPMSAMPWSPYGVDQDTLFALVTTQLEYYFSLENLCKDIFLRKHMDSKGFVYLSFIADFNRIKHLTTDMELIKYVCYQSPTIEFRVGVDGKDRLRRRDGWEQWVLGMRERDPSAQNDGPEELHNPPMPYPNGFEPVGLPYSGNPAGSPTSQAPQRIVNGVHPGAAQDVSATVSDNIPNGQATNGVNGFTGSNGHLETSTIAVSGEPDSFSDEQVESLSVIVRKQEQPQEPALPPSTTRTFSNGSIDSKSGMSGESEKTNGWQSAPTANGTSTAQGIESKSQDDPQRPLSPFAPTSGTAVAPVRLYWVKGKDAPVDSLPLDSSYESYTHLRFKALEQRDNAAHGSCPYDMDVLYQFWSHFLIRNFNLQMYQEFRHFAFEDSALRGSDIGLTNLIKYYGESLLSTQSLMRESVARHYVELVQSEMAGHRPAFLQLQSVYRDGTMDPINRKRIGDLLDADLRASLE